MPVAKTWVVLHHSPFFELQISEDYVTLIGNIFSRLLPSPTKHVAASNPFPNFTEILEWCLEEGVNYLDCPRNEY